MTTISKMLVGAVTTAALAMGATTANAQHYTRSCGSSYASYAPSYYTPVYAPAPVVYAAPAYSYYRPVTYVRPAYYPAPRYYAPAPVYRSYYAPTYYAPSRWGFGFGYSRGGHGGYGGYRGHRGHHSSHHGGGFSFHIGG